MSVTSQQRRSICETCDPSLPLVIQADERRRTKRSDKVNGTQTAASPWVRV